MRHPQSRYQGGDLIGILEGSAKGANRWGYVTARNRKGVPYPLAYPSIQRRKFISLKLTVDYGGITPSGVRSKCAALVSVAALELRVKVLT